MVSDQHIVEPIPVDPDAPYPLGRGINHDPASADYPYQPRRAAPVVDRDRWASTLDILDQSLGSCVPHTGVEGLATANVQRPPLSTVDYKGKAIDLTSVASVEDFIENDDGLYHDVTYADPFDGGWRPDDTGSDGTSLGNLFIKLGWVESFHHAFSGLSDVLQGLNEGTVWMGSNWYDSMFYPRSDGVLEISPNATVAGGHQYLLTGRIDTTRRLVEMRNHWRADWGLGGYAWMPWDMGARLLDEQGDAQIVRWKVGVVPPFPEDPGQSLGCLGQFLPASMRRLPSDTHR